MFREAGKMNEPLCLVFTICSPMRIRFLSSKFAPAVDVWNRLMKVQSLNDPVVNYIGSMQLFELLGSEEKSFVMFDMDRHVIIEGEGSHRVQRAIGGFIEDIRKKFGGYER
jgi:esterase/lipase